MSSPQRRTFLLRAGAAALTVAATNASSLPIPLTEPAMRYTHDTAPTEYLDANGARYAFRHFGSDNGVPIILLQHFRGNMDYWDPALTDGLAQRRTVYLFDNAGVGFSSGRTPETIAGMADHVAAFVIARGLPVVDVLGFSIGGMVAQELALRHPHLVRRLILAGTGPRGGVPGTDPKVPAIATRASLATMEETAYLFFDAAPESQQAAAQFWQRRHRRSADLDKLSGKQVIDAQVAALTEWASSPNRGFAQLREITQPTLVINGSNDIMVPTVNSYTLQQHIPNATLVIYPKSGHGALFQYAADVVAQANRFLD